MGKQRDSSASGEKLRQFKRARWKHFVRWFGLITVVTLNISLVASNIRLLSLHRMDLGHELLSYALLVFLDVVFLLPTLFEVDNIVVAPDSLNLKMLLWQAKLPWSKIVSCQKPSYLAYAIVKTERCFYLINKRDIPEFDQLLELIQSQLPNGQQCISG